jgi:hypothetical protein
VLVALAVATAGCGGGVSMSTKPFYPVKGKVTLPDGKPLAGVDVVFSGPYLAIARTESDGTFAVKGEKEGLPEGEYKVRLEGSGSKSAAKRATLPFPSRYSDEDTTDLTAKVTAAGPNEFNFPLTKDEPGGPSKKGR